MQEQQMTQEQQLQQQLGNLKIRIFDLQEANQVQGQELQTFAQQVCQATGVEIEEGMDLKGIISAIHKQNTPMSPEEAGVAEEALEQPQE